MQEDLSATVNEAAWFVAADHMEELMGMASSWGGRRDIHLIDLFGFSGSLAQQWARHGYQSVQYDVLIGGRVHDLCSKRGFLCLLRPQAAKESVGPGMRYYVWGVGIRKYRSFKGGGKPTGKLQAEPINKVSFERVRFMS